MIYGRRLVSVFASAIVLSTIGGPWGWSFPFSGPTDTSHPIDPAIPFDSPRFREWANAIDPTRTYFAPRGSTSISLTGWNSLGDLDASEIAAGALPGYITVTFPRGVANGPGHDFAVFENGFVFPQVPFLFAELAYVEVSTDGDHFARFPSVSRNTSWAGGFGQALGGFDMTKVFNLAGKHADGFGTPFDLQDLRNDPLVASGLVDLRNIQFVRLVDIPGNGSFRDSQGHPILDPWLTQGTGGFDFRLPAGKGVGVFYVSRNRQEMAEAFEGELPFAARSPLPIPEPSCLSLLLLGCLSVLANQRRHP